MSGRAEIAAVTVGRPRIGRDCRKFSIGSSGPSGTRGRGRKAHPRGGSVNGLGGSSAVSSTPKALERALDGRELSAYRWFGV